MTGSRDGFVHLHVHTEYSMLDGASLLDGLFERTARLEMPAIAMTDHGNLHGAFDFWSKARAHGVKPIIGLEAYLTPGTRREERRRVRWGRGDLAEEGGDDVAGGGAYTHMTMWASSTEGMHNLFRLASRSSIEGFYYKPRADRELLNQYAEGLIASTGCPSGEVQTRLRLGQYDEARTAAAEYQEIFGKENFFLELMDHDIQIEKRTRDDLLRLDPEQLGEDGADRPEALEAAVVAHVDPRAVADVLGQREQPVGEVELRGGGLAAGEVELQSTLPQGVVGGALLGEEGRDLLRRTLAEGPGLGTLRVHGPMLTEARRRFDFARTAPVDS